MTTAPRQFSPDETPRVTHLADLDALVGAHIVGETPESFWEDSHGHFQFDSEAEARLALSDPYYQKFLPDVDWAQTVIRQVRVYRPYCSDPGVNWQLVEKATAQFGAMKIWREEGRWHAAFGGSVNADARTPSVAICLAALRAKGIAVEVRHDRLDAQLNQLGALPVEKSDPAV